MIYLNRIVSDLLSTKGVLHDGKKVLCHTFEPPFLQNLPNVSCIPTGVYDLALSHSSKFGSVYRFAYVPHRSHILIHVGNNLSDTRGCILVGLDVNDVGVIQSKLAMNRLLKSLPERFQLTIQ